MSKSSALLLLLLSVPAAAKDDQTYRNLELFSRVLSYVENNYVEPVDEQQLIYGALRGMTDTLDPHTVFMPPELFRDMKEDTTGEFGGLGVEIARKADALVVVAPMDDQPAARAGIKSGDLILEIDGESTRGMDVTRAVQKLRGKPGSKVRLGIMREGFTAAREISVVRDHVRVVAVEGGLYGGIGHVRIKNFQERVDRDLKKELDRLRALNNHKELRGLVLDLRNNPGGLLDQAVAISDRFLPGNLPIVTTRGRSNRNVTEEKSRDRDTEKGYPIVVLVNAGSASASEIVAGALQDHARGVILGMQTFGKGSVQTVIELEDGSGLKLTIARYYTPRGRSIQEKGITPDFIVGDKAGPLEKGKEVQPRERDLRRHFKGEDGETEEVNPAVTLPPNLKDWTVTESLADYQLKVALNYLNGGASATHAKAAPK